MSNLQSKVVLLKCLVEANVCKSSPCKFWCSPDCCKIHAKDCLHIISIDTNERVISQIHRIQCPYRVCCKIHYEDKDKCCCVYKSKIVYFIITLPDKFTEYNIGENILNYNWNTEINMDSYVIFSINDINTEKTHNLQRHTNKFTALNAAIIDINDSIINTQFTDIIEDFRKKESAKNEKIKLINERKKLMNDSLTNRGLEILKDRVSEESRLYSDYCYKYIFGSNIYSADMLTNLMCKKKYLVEYCHSNDIFFSLPYKKRYIIDIDRKALDKYSNGKYPSIYPWENGYVEEPKPKIRCIIM